MSEPPGEIVVQPRLDIVLEAYRRSADVGMTEPYIDVDDLRRLVAAIDKYRLHVGTSAVKVRTGGRADVIEVIAWDWARPE